MTSQLPDDAIGLPPDLKCQVHPPCLYHQGALEGWDRGVTAALPALTGAVTAQATDPVYRERDQLVAACRRCRHPLQPGWYPYCLDCLAYYQDCDDGAHTPGDAT